MTSYALRIRQLRDRAGKSHVEVAQAVGINLPWYYDVETYDDEATMTLSVRQLQLLAQTLGVSLRHLLTSADELPAPPPPPPPQQQLNFADVAGQLRTRADADGIAAVEAAVGWRLEHFLADPAVAWDEPADFLRFVCEFLDVDWMDALPADPPPSH
jgi:transcriptional regulator with XRE-family HTH domain